MSAQKKLKKKDWYEILNYNLKFTNKDLDELKYKSRTIMKEQIKLDLMGSGSVGKIKDKNETRNLTEIKFGLDRENKLVSTRFNIKNYKSKNYMTGNSDSLFMKNIIEKIDQINRKKVPNNNIQSKSKSNIQTNNLNTQSFNFNELSLYNRSKCRTNMTHRSEIKKKFLNTSKDIKKITFKKLSENSMFKTYNNLRNDNKNNNKNSKNRIIFFPKIKRKETIQMINDYNSKKEKKKNMINTILTEEDKSMNKGKSLSYSIFKLNKDFNKLKKTINGYSGKKIIYDDDDDDFIIINNKKIYQINLEKEINKKFRENYLNIRRPRDIEEKLLNGNKNLFDLMRLNLLKKYRYKKKYKNYKWRNNDSNDN